MMYFSWACLSQTTRCLFGLRRHVLRALASFCVFISDLALVVLTGEAVISGAPSSGKERGAGEAAGCRPRSPGEEDKGSVPGSGGEADWLGVVKVRSSPITAG